MTNYIDWTGFSGYKYRYWFIQGPAVASNIQSKPGNYMFIKPHETGGWVPIYIGIADDLSMRISCHDRWDDCVNAGATQVVAHINEDAAAREAEERDMIRGWQPVLNSQHRSLGALLGGLGS